MSKSFNLHQQGHTRKEVYDAMNDHCNRDARSIAFWQSVYLICAGAHAYLSSNPHILFFYLGGFCLYKALFWHSEVIHRHWFLHKVDWEERERLEPEFNNPESPKSWSIIDDELESDKI